MLMRFVFIYGLFCYFLADLLDTEVSLLMLTLLIGEAPMWLAMLVALVLAYVFTPGVKK